ncbi:MAG: glycosyltransferase family 2 protein [Chitinophagaceae bacterium]|nr:glycosyltransferase family 2 protein [Chitinophagaceae bacterium]
MATDQLPKVSICIPTYNQIIYLDILLRSIEKQTFTDYEIILSDDSTTDNVQNLLNNFSFGHKLTYTRNKPSLGSPSNWNAAISKAKGEYVKIMHHDDAFTSYTSLEEMVNFIEANNYDYIFTDTKVNNVKKPEESREHTIRKLSKIIRKPYLLFFGNSIGSPSTLLLKREKFAQLKYDSAYIWLVDIEYYTRLFSISSKGNSIPKPLIITHGSAEHQLTSKILTNFPLQAREQALLYNQLSQEASSISEFFMQIYFVRLLFKGKLNDKKILAIFSQPPLPVRIYFSVIKFKPLYFACKILTQLLDMTRKLFL